MNQLKQVKHTATPFKIDGVMRHDESIKIDGVGNGGICFVSDLNLKDKSLQEANAEFIVRACNSHDKLVEALKNAQKAISKAEAEGVYKNCVLPLFGKKTLEQIESALKEAGE